MQGAWGLYQIIKGNNHRDWRKKVSIMLIRNIREHIPIKKHEGAFDGRIQD